RQLIGRWIQPDRFRAFCQMPQKIMDVLMLGRCSHEFAWPRRAANGEYYQVCLQCAAAYQYDWKTMRRGNRVETPLADTAAVKRRSSAKQPTWVPRARRLKLDVPIRFRVKNLSTWFEGVIQNISQSGVLFIGPQPLPANALVEMVFEMPEEISGQKNSSVLCQGRLIRAKEARTTEDGSILAASILDYKFIRQE
ncbi:MAG TPA: PilZ domain-containing protein, partial [Terriglobales bacterium]|nr:PilZ domain-containing protein [Terriglobales bacterium]